MTTNVIDGAFSGNYGFDREGFRVKVKQAYIEARKASRGQHITLGEPLHLLSVGCILEHVHPLAGPNTPKVYHATVAQLIITHTSYSDLYFADVMTHANKLIRFQQPRIASTHALNYIIRAFTLEDGKQMDFCAQMVKRMNGVIINVVSTRSRDITRETLRQGMCNADDVITVCVNANMHMYNFHEEILALRKTYEACGKPI